MDEGRVDQPSLFTPSAIAPEETSTTCLPERFNSAICAAHASTAVASSPRPPFGVPPGGPQHAVLPRAFKLRDLRRPRGARRGVQPTPIIRDEARADLDD